MQMGRFLMFLLAAVGALLPGTGAHHVPDSPCPSVFQYEASPSGSWHGILRVPPPEPKTSLKVVVVTVLKASLPSKYFGMLTPIGDTNELSLGLLRGNLQAVQYRITFPLENPLPIMRSVTANGNIICRGPEVTAPVLTTISLDYTLIPPMTANNPYPQSPHQESGRPIYEVGKPIRPPEFEYIEQYGRPIHSPHQRTHTRLPATPSEHHDECGQVSEPSKLIANGTPTRRGQWPWLAALFHYNNNGGRDYVCSSTLINDRHVVTAAHCLQKDNEELPPEGVVVYVGKFNLYYEHEDAQAMEVKEVFMHNDYKPNDYRTPDIAVLQFKQKVVFGLLVRPICIWNRSSNIEPWIGEMGTVVGWGRDENGRNITAEPRMVKVPIVSYKTCISRLPHFSRITSSRTFCAGAGDGSGPCNGDSGSGFVMPLGDESSPSWYLRGIVSKSLRAKLSSFNACNLEEYIVYTDVAKFSNWLQPYLTR